MQFNVVVVSNHVKETRMEKNKPVPSAIVESAVEKKKEYRSPHCECYSPLEHVRKYDDNSSELEF
jgi:hypothetical protein